MVCVVLGLQHIFSGELWVARCIATFEGKTMKAREVCLKVIYRVQLLAMVIFQRKLRPGRKVWC